MWFQKVPDRKNLGSSTKRFKRSRKHFVKPFGTKKVNLRYYNRDEYLSHQSMWKKSTSSSDVLNGIFLPGYGIWNSKNIGNLLLRLVANTIVMRVPNRYINL